MAAHPRPRVTPAPRSAWTWAAPVVVGALALLAYANSLGNGFVWDDPIILSRQLIVFRSLGDVLAPPRDIPQFSPDYYRPVTIASYLLDRSIGGGDPFAFHLSVVLAHAATSVLVYVLALQLLGYPGGRGLPHGPPPQRGGSAPPAESANARSGGAAIGAFAAGALFALHPIHTESVAWAAGRSDVLATGFLLAALAVHGRPRRTWAGSAVAGLCAAAALGAKETAVALYPLMLMRDLIVAPASRRTAAEWLRGYAGPLLAGAAYVLLRRHALGEFVGSTPDALAAGQRSVGDLVAALGTYVGRLLWPVHLNAYIDQIAVEPLTIAPALLLIGAIAAAAWQWWKGSRIRGFKGSSKIPTRSMPRPVEPPNPSRSDPRTLGPSNPSVPLFALAWLALTLVPSLAIVWKIPDAPLAERYLYLPSVGFCLLVGDVVARLWAAASTRPARWATAAGVGALLLAAAVGTVRRNPVWHDDVALWTDTEQKSRVSGMAARGLGTAYQQSGRIAESRAAFERALQRRNTPRGLQTIYNNLGTMAMYDRDYTAAQRYYQAALAQDPNSGDALFNLGLAVLQGGGATREAAQAALPHYQRALAVNPHDADIEAALAQAFDILGQPAAAAQHARRALELGAQGQTADGLRALLRRGESR